MTTPNLPQVIEDAITKLESLEARINSDPDCSCSGYQIEVDAVIVLLQSLQVGVTHDHP